jgi:hypothetical protein
MAFPSKPTTQDLSDRPELAGWPSFDSSMGGGNMITEKNPHFAGRGSDSEGTHDVVAHALTDFGNVQRTPPLPGPDAVGGEHAGTRTVTAGSHSPAAPAWKKTR